MTGSPEQKEYGDYQTPLGFANRVCEYLRDTVKLQPTVIIEPTCGIGNYLESSRTVFPDTPLIGIDINADYISIARARMDRGRVALFASDFFQFDFSKIVREWDSKEILIVGNPPWVTNSALSVLNSKNTPLKSNFKGHKGLDAITGSANFDICEFMLLSLIGRFQNTNTTIAMLCKTSVARNVFCELVRTGVGFDYAKLMLFDAKSVFDVSVDSGLFVFHLTETARETATCTVCDFENPSVEKYSFGFRGDVFYSRIDDDAPDFNGKSCYTWRQGIKHDCSKIMELTKNGIGLINGNKDMVDIEDTYVFPLIKSSAVKNCLITSSKKYVIVTQEKIGADTSIIKSNAPKTWAYLQEHKALFDGRKSSIYSNAPAFAMFGIGEYSFGKYKVGISGFYKNPRFALLASDKAIMMDDTCYFINLNTYDEAYTIMLLLNSAKVQQFIRSISFVDSKRPYTKKVLERIDFGKAFNSTTIEELRETERELGLPAYITAEMLSLAMNNANNRHDEDSVQMQLAI
jgi:methylase of polypeptide subunit release factors